MREIKFRAWDKIEKIMYTNNKLMEFHFLTNGRIINRNMKHWELLFYTGIKATKTRQEVYFGDKIKLEGDDDYSRYDGWIVSDKEPLYILLESPDGKDHIPLFSFEYRATISEVIGNIFEEPTKPVPHDIQIKKGMDI